MNDKIEIVEVLQALFDGKKIIFSVAGVFLILAVLGMVIVTPKYTASMIIAPSSVSSQSQNSLSQFSGVASLVGITLPIEDELSSYIEFQERLASYHVAEKLAEKPGTLQKVFPQYWNAEKDEWNTRPGLVLTIRYAIGRVFGLPGWTPPDAEDLMAYISAEVSTQIDTDQLLLTIEFDHEDPIFAQEFVTSLHEETDRIVRHDALKRTSHQVSYLEEKLLQAKIPEHKTALAELLLGQEQKLMMLEVDLPYAARILSDARVSSEPTFPRPITFIIISLVAGVLFGILLVYILDFVRSLRIQIQK